MVIKNITYQRVLNLGNYESKRLELSAKVLEGDDPNEETSRLMEMVEQIESQISQLRTQLRNFQREYEIVKASSVKASSLFEL
ncbi:hypothetical protein [Nostoc sp. CHAB 5715]|uniref:hypothetical protein n=1 Tax=Nostoc sp. CHAB 5715 TaxID=2780400 RepID=UPI001E5D4328|nr:hypothetical protein [Nostoc sp. CHAB 5715]MCC5623256.1 hypothetical protein [Nostoc sp. CHAB 5715]